MPERYDVVVIGSGFGGAVTAARLAQAGRSVCLLERGRRWDKREFPRSIGQVKNAMWRDKESYGFIEYKVFRRIDVIQGAGVGGGSLHYFNVHLRAPVSILERAEWPARIKRATMEPYYDLAQDMLDSKPLEPRPPRYPLPKRTQAFAAAAAAAGRTAERVPIAVYTGPPAPNRHSGVPQEPCDYAGDCLLGCRTHSKNTLDLTYLAMAESKHGLEIRPLHSANYVEPTSAGYRVHFTRFDPDQPGHGEPGSIEGKQVVVSAGSLGSTELLLRSRDRQRTLPRLPAALGRRFSGNGDMLFAGTLGTDRPIEPGDGPSITIGADFSRPGSKHRVFIEDLGFPNPFLWLLEGTLPSASRSLGLVRAVGSYLGAALGAHRKDHSRIGFESDNLFAGNRTEHFLPFLGMGTDAGDGVMSLDERGDLDLDWDPAGSMEMFREMELGFQELSRGAGGHYLQSLLWHWPFRRLLTAHPLGGCVMSDRSEDGVVNDRGEVWGHPGLFVVDGAIIPGPLSVNPSMTITALSERAAQWMIHGKEIGERRIVVARAPEPHVTEPAA
ncbi:MAG TPA: GMC family oxidoreductase [Kofleriaceae bacterium]